VTLIPFVTSTFYIHHIKIMTFSKPIFEGDAKTIIDFIFSPSSNFYWEISSIVANIQAILCNFSSVFFNFLFSPRSSNGLTHNTTRWVSFCNSWDLRTPTHQLHSLMGPC
jgi:hypothetical protein